MKKSNMSKLLDIVLHPNPILRKKSQEIDPKSLENKDIRQLILDMAKTMREKDGAGLAAPQIGKNIRLLAIDLDGKDLIMINPKITKKSWAKEIEDEGCLSVLDKNGKIIYGKVARHKKINCGYLDEKGKKKTLSVDKMLARVIQHEIDHLEGVLFIDRLENSPAEIEDAQN